MTQNIFFDAVIIFLIAYAIIDIFYEISELILNKFSRTTPKDYIVLPLKHGDENLECAIRFAVKKSNDLRCALVIIEENLDNTEKMILWHLTGECKNVVVSTPQELSDKLKTAELINTSLTF